MFVRTEDVIGFRTRRASFTFALSFFKKPISVRLPLVLVLSFTLRDCARFENQGVGRVVIGGQNLTPKTHVISGLEEENRQGQFLFIHIRSINFMDAP